MEAVNKEALFGDMEIFQKQRDKTAHVIVTPNKKGHGHKVDYETGKTWTHLDFPRSWP